MKDRKYFWVIVAIAVFCAGIAYISMESQHEIPRQEQSVHGALSPFASTISGIGLVEPKTGNIDLGIASNRLIMAIPVSVGMKVKKGDVLFSLDLRDLKAELASREAAYQTALANVQKATMQPREEDIAIAEGAYKEALAQSTFTKEQYQKVEDLKDKRALSQEEINRRQSAYEQAEAKLKQAEANLEKVRKGTWEPDLAILKFQAMQARANRDQVLTEIQKNIVRSPIDGTVLQINIHEGEIPDPAKTPVMVIGDIDELHLKVGINQLDIPFFDPHSKAVAYLQGDTTQKYDLTFLYIEPYVTSKQNVTHDILEKIDSRVMNVVYKIEQEGKPLVVGQPMDVFIERKGS